MRAQRKDPMLDSFSASAFAVRPLRTTQSLSVNNFCDANGIKLNRITERIIVNLIRKDTIALAVQKRTLGSLSSHKKSDPAHPHFWLNCLPNEEEIENFQKPTYCSAND